MNRFALVDETYNVVVRDIEHGLNLFFLAEGGHGPTSSSRALAQRVVDFLNTLPPGETKLYPFAGAGGPA